jgi:hypothetical protein
MLDIPHRRGGSHWKVSRTMPLVSISLYPYPRAGFSIDHADYPRTLREWGRRLEANLTRDMIAEDYPVLRDVAEFDAFKRKWQYLFAYAGAGFAKGYIACHMLTFIREVRLSKSMLLLDCILHLFIFRMISLLRMIS